MSTLPDVLRRLCRLAPDHFKQVGTTIYIVRGGVWRGVASSETYVDEDRVQGALIEAIDAKGWDWSYHSGGWMRISNQCENYTHKWATPFVLALALALEAALKQEQEQKETSS